MGKTTWEVKEMLRSHDVIELKLSERKSKNQEDDELKIYE